MILPDTSVWVDYLGRQRRAGSKLLETRLQKPQEVFICPPVLQEVLQGARDEISFGRLRKQLEALPWTQAGDTPQLAIQAARLYARLRWQGVTIRSPNDCLIACIAIENNLALLHDDADFLKIAATEPRLKLVALPA